MKELLKKFRHWYLDQRGVSLIVVIFTMLILAILGWTLTNLFSANFEMNRLAIESEQALFIAEAGIQEAIMHLAVRDTVFDNDTKWLNRSFGAGEYRVRRQTSGNLVNITSWGYVPSGNNYHALRQVFVTVRSGQPGFTFGAGTVIYSTGSVTIGNNVVVVGNITQNAPPDTLPAVVVPDPPLNLPNLGTLTVTGNQAVTIAAGNYKYTSISIAGNSNLNIFGPTNIYLTGANSFTTEGIANLNIRNNQPVHFYFDGNLTIGGNGVIGNPNNVANLVFWGTANNRGTITLAGNGQFFGVIYAPQATLRITGNGQYTGEFIGGSVTLGGNAQIRFDPAVNSVVLPGANPGDEGNQVLFWQEQ
ncbi:MAG: hypothetical protein N2606_00930 [Candidatus Omnitrophica bacterium]|nr:hypothetical protein [Candidatus Omnitrophota bacterium]